MTIRSDEAAAMLADVDSVVAKVKQSRIYRSAALIIMLWGAINLARDGLIALAPGWFGPRWFLVDAIGVAGTIAILQPRRDRRRPPAAADAGRVPVVLRLRLDLGQPLGDFGPRQQMAFWPTLFLFGYAVAGLWFGAAFTAHRPRPHRLDRRDILLVGRGFSAVAWRSSPAADSSCAASGCGGPEAMDGPDEIIHQPIRLRVMAALTALRSRATRASTSRGSRA